MKTPLSTAAALTIAFFLSYAPSTGASLPPIRIAFIPLDDRPATEQFPRQTAAICGTQLELPPQELLGHFTTPGNSDALARWLVDLDTRGIAAVVVSADMLAYGGLVASRTPATSLADARSHIRALTRFHELHPNIPVYVFGTIMRLAPTETPQSEPYLDALTTYAQLAGETNPTRDDQAAIAQARAGIPNAVFWDYAGARARDVQIDQQLLSLAAQGDIAWLVLTQDDAGAPDGLQVAEQRTLALAADELGVRDRVIFNPGADEMGMVVVTRAIEDAVHWYPSAKIEYSIDRERSIRDPLEDVVVARSIDGISRALHVSTRGEQTNFYLRVFMPATPPDARTRFFENLSQRLRTGEPTAIADLTFIDDDIAEERIAFEALANAGVADRPLSYASWNTTANSVGTALSAAACAALANHFDARTTAAQKTFLFDRYVDDYAYRLLVRPQLNAELRQAGYDTFALGRVADFAEAQARRRLWPMAVDLFDDNFQLHAWRLREIGISLPWQRTFEVRLDAQLESADSP